MPKVSKRKPKSRPPYNQTDRPNRSKLRQKIVRIDFTKDKFCEEDFEKFLVNYTGFGSTAQACKAAGVETWQLNRWLRRNPEKLDELKRSIEAPILMQIREAMLTDWRAGAWILERSFPQRYALTNIIRHDGTVNITMVDKVPEDEAIRFAHDIREMETSIVAMPKLLSATTNGNHNGNGNGTNGHSHN